MHVAADWPYPHKAPDPKDASPAVDGHLGDGVFFQGVEYVQHAGSTIAVNAKLFIARLGDGNADTLVDGADISQLAARFNSEASYPRNRFWFDMDTAGDPVTGRSGGYVDGADISALIEGWTGDPGPAAEGGFAAAMSYTEVLLGAFSEPGTNASEFTIEYVTGYGQPRRQGSVTVIPEPGTVVMLVSGLLGLLLLWRRRAR